jgi:hypothetical protein
MSVRDQVTDSEFGVVVCKLLDQTNHLSPEHFNAIELIVN